MTTEFSNPNKALVVLSGGQDSTTCLAIAVKHHGADNVKAITFDYGQRHSREIQAAHDVAYLFGIQPPETIVVGPHVLAGTSPLTDKTAELEQYADYKSMDAIIGDRVEKTFVPMRNALFLTIAANRAVVNGHHWIYTGVCQADNANYPDCRKVFVSAQQHTINQALGLDDIDPLAADADKAIHICTPLMFLSKAASIRMLIDHCGPQAFAKLAWSHTAYDGQYPPLGSDHATLLRAQGFLESGWPDPLVVRAWAEGLMELPQTDNYADIAGVVNALLTIIDMDRETLTNRSHGSLIKEGA